MRQPFIISVLLFLSITIYGQSFCEKNLGYNWAAFPLHQLNNKKNFERDSIIFIRPQTNDSDYVFIDLKCSDSTFNIVLVYMVPGLYTPREKVASRYPFPDGKWSLNEKNNTITFQLTETGKSYSYKIITIGDKKTNKTVLWSSVGDYRTKILLIRQ